MRRIVTAECLSPHVTLLSLHCQHQVQLTHGTAVESLQGWTYCPTCLQDGRD